MGKLFEKLETLVDELTGLVREERERRNQHAFGLPWELTCHHGQASTETDNPFYRSSPGGGV